MLLVGIRERNFPTPLEAEVLCSFIDRNYGGHTPSEIKLAFDLAISGQLGTVKTEAFENFSVEYVSRIMNAYRKWYEANVAEVIQPDDTDYYEKRKPKKWQIDCEYAYALLIVLKSRIEQRKPLKF